MQVFPRDGTSHMNRTRATWRALGALPILMICGLAPALAQQPTQAQANAIRQACRTDYQAHCSSVPTGGSAALACLQDNAASLSPGCQTALGAVGGGAGASVGTPAAPPSARTPPAKMPPMTPRQEATLMRQSCGSDYHAYCSGVRPGGGRAIACLQDHGASLSRQCRSALAAAQSR